MNELNFLEIGKRIKKRRQETGLTQEAVANRLNVNPSHISNIECGHANPSLTALVNIANILECSVDYFLEREYTFSQKEMPATLDKQISRKLRFADNATKEKVLKMIDLL